MGGQYTKDFQNIYPSLAELNHVNLIPFLLEGVGGNPALNQQDGIHPTVEGHKIVAENVWKILQKDLSE
jgi:acyl-CoA thioesterase-1